MILKMQQKTVFGALDPARKLATLLQNPSSDGLRIKRECLAYKKG